MAPALPTWPLILFGVVEPALLTWATVFGLTDPVNAYAGQTPNYVLTTSTLEPPAVALVTQLANIYALLALMALVCCWTSSAGVARGYLLSVALADFGHIAATYVAMGPDNFFDVAGWNDVVWGNVGVSLFLNVNRWLTLLGLFGRLNRTDVKGPRKSQ